MRFDLQTVQEVAQQIVQRAAHVAQQVAHVAASLSPAGLMAAGGVALATLVVIYGALLGTGERSAEAELQADAVAVTGSVYTPVAVTAPAPERAASPYGAGAPVARRLDDDLALTSAVQTELKRAGCYTGPVNGVWTASTRAAMGEFTTRVNARLPVDRADPVHLALLDTHNKISCTADCTTGGEESCEGRSVLPEQRAETRRGEVAGIEKTRPDEKRQDAQSSLAPTQVKVGAEDLGYSDEERRAPNPIAAVQTASGEPDDDASDASDVTDVGMEEAAPLAAAAAVAPKVAKPEPRRASRKYKQPSIARQVSRGLRQIQRDLNKLF